jgi:hypothetical protein
MYAQKERVSFGRPWECIAAAAFDFLQCHKTNVGRRHLYTTAAAVRQGCQNAIEQFCVGMCPECFAFRNFVQTDHYSNFGILFLSRHLLRQRYARLILDWVGEPRLIFTLEWVEEKKCYICR